MSEKDMREILAGEYANQRERSEGSITDRTKGTVEAALRAMQEVERRTIERCAKVARSTPIRQMEFAESVAHEIDIEAAIRALQDAPSDAVVAHARNTKPVVLHETASGDDQDTPPAKEGV